MNRLALSGRFASSSPEGGAKDVSATALASPFERFSPCRGEMEKNIEEYKAVAERLKLKIKKEKAALEIILSKLDEEQKIKYSTLKEKKGKVVAEVIDGKCRGCHITIPLFIMCKLKNKDEITYCDNCGRILYYREQGYINTVKTNA